NPGIFPVNAVRSSPDPATAVALVSASSLELLSFSGVPSSSSNASVSTTLVGVRGLTRPPPADQENGASGINTGDFRVQSPNQDPSGTVWLAADDGCVPQGDSAYRSCLRVIALHGAAEVLDTDIAWTGGHFFYPALAADGAGNAIVVYGYSSSTTYS